MSKEKIDELRNSLTPSVGFELLMQNESLTKERDAYRDLCAELLDALLSQDELSKKGLLGAGFAEIDKVRELRKSAIIKAESILGEKNGTAN